jgi:hypothetical protein
MSARFIFGYGSLINPESVAGTIGRSLTVVDGPFPTTLRGWRACWNVGSDSTSHPEREFRRPDGTRYDGVVVALGIEPAPGARCAGVVFRVHRAELAGLDLRERNYDRTDVTASIEWAGRPAECTVHTYVPTAVARGRLCAAVTGGRPVAVRRGYLGPVEHAVPPPPFEVLDLDVGYRAP